MTVPTIFGVRGLQEHHVAVLRAAVLCDGTVRERTDTGDIGGAKIAFLRTLRRRRLLQRDPTEDVWRITDLGRRWLDAYETRPVPGRPAATGLESGATVVAPTEGET